MAGGMYNAKVIFRKDVGPDTAVFRIEPDDVPIPEFTSGQFVIIGLEGDTAATKPEELVRRPYSIASQEHERNHVELLISRVGEGELTSRLWQLQVGSRLWMDGRIKGTFTLDEIPRETDLLMVSTGTGVAPFVSMMRSYRSTGRWNRFVLINGTRTAADLGYHSELEAISRYDSSIDYLPTVSREPESSNWQGLRGRVQEALVDLLDASPGGHIDRNQCHAFLCGSPDMIESVSGMLVDRGFSIGTKGAPGNLHFERYWT